MDFLLFLFLFKTISSLIILLNKGINHLFFCLFDYRCYLLHQEVDDSFDSCSSAIHDFIHCPHIVTSIRDACEGNAIFGVYDVAHRLPIVRDLHSMTHQIWREFGKSVPVVCHGILMDLKGAQDKLHFQGHNDWVRTLATDDWVLYSGASDGTVRVWDLETMEATGVLTGHDASIEDLVLSPDGALLFSASVDHTIRAWDTDSLTQVAVLEGHHRDVHTVKIYIPNKTLLEGKLVEEKEEQPFNMSLLSGSMDGTIIFWSMENFEQEGIIKLEKDSIGILSLEYNFNDLFAGCTDNSIRQFDIDGKQQIRVLRSHHDWVRCMAVFDHKLFTSCDGGELRVWDLNGRLNVVGEADVADRSYGMRVIEDAIYFPCGSQGVFKLDPKTLKVTSVPHNHHHHHGPMYCLTNSAKRGTMYGGFQDGSILEYLLTDH